MLLLLESLESSLLVVGLIGSVFFTLDWWLPNSFLWKRAEKLLSRTVEETKAKDVSIGVRFRLICTIHNLIQMVLGVVALSSPVLWNDSLFGTTPLSRFVVALSAGFFIWDVTFALRRVKFDGVVPIFHGVVCSSLLFYNVITGSGHFYGVGSILWEFSTPCVHARWILYKLGLEGSKLYYYNGLMMIVSFAICRVCWGSFLALKFLTLDQATLSQLSLLTIWGLRVLTFAGIGLNYYWFFTMLSIAHKAIRNRSKSN